MTYPRYSSNFGESPFPRSSSRYNACYLKKSLSELSRSLNFYCNAFNSFQNKFVETDYDFNNLDEHNNLCLVDDGYW